MDSLLYINEDKVKELLRWEDTFRATEVALESVSKKCVFQNERSFTKVLNTSNLLLTMPGYLKDSTFGALGCKLVTVAKGNEKLEKPLPIIIANIALFDENTGVLKAIVAGTEITKWRTAAASAVATKHLRNPSKNCNNNILAILGAGVQGRIHAIAFHHFFGFKEIRVWNHNPEKAISLVEELNNLNVNTKGVFKAVANNQDCVRDADVVITATFATEPIVKLAWLKADAHINAVGAGVTHHSELEEAIYLSSDVYIDHWAGAKAELYGLEKLGVKFKGEIGSIISGELPKPTYDGDEDRITIFQSLGMAVEDCTMARMVYDLYQKKQKML